MVNGGKKVEKASGPVEVKGKVAPTFLDYAFAPGNTDLDETMRKLFKKRPKTTLIEIIVLGDLRDFIRELQKQPLQEHPIRDLILASHANMEGVLMMHMGILTPEIRYADLEEADKKGSIRIPPQILSPRPKDANGNQIPATVHIRGCRIGMQEPFLRMLKKALGVARVTAPKHFHMSASEYERIKGKRKGKIIGFTEYMQYVSKSTDLLNSLIDNKQSMGSGIELSEESMEQKCHQMNGKTGYQKIYIQSKKTEARKFEKKSMVKEFVNPVTWKTEKSLTAEFRYRERPLFENESSIDLASDPVSDRGRKDAVRANLV